MNKNKRHRLYNEAAKKWGKVNQLDMLTEESAELIQAINKFKRNDNVSTVMNLASEVADVEIMIEQLKLNYNITAQVKGYTAQKLFRLEQRIKDANHK